jgi:hypothetical protein
MSVNNASTAVRDRHDHRVRLLLLAVVGALLVNPLMGIAVSTACAVATPRRRWLFLAVAALLMAWFLLFLSGGIEQTSHLGTPIRRN